MTVLMDYIVSVQVWLCLVPENFVKNFRNEGKKGFFDPRLDPFLVKQFCTFWEIWTILWKDCTNF